MLTLPFPPSVNRYWRHWQGRTLISAAGRAYRATAVLAVRESRLAAFGDVSLRVCITAWLPDARRRDVDNLAKAPLDAMAASGLFDDDSQIVDLRIVKAGIDRGNPRLEVVLERAA